MRKVVMLTAGLACLLLSGCSAAAFWLSDCGDVNADVVVVNKSERDVYSIVLEYKDSTEMVQAANGSALLEPGQSYGLELDEEEGIVTLRDRAEKVIGRSRVARQEGWRQFISFDGVTEGSSWVEERPHV